MESYLISDNLDTLVGMKMAGISGELLLEPEAILSCVDRLIEASDIGIIIVTSGVMKLVRDEIMARKLTTKKTLIVEIPGPNESIQKDFITQYIRESIGLKL